MLLFQYWLLGVFVLYRFYTFKKLDINFYIYDIIWLGGYIMAKIYLGSGLKEANCFDYKSCINIREIHIKAVTPPDCSFADFFYNNATLYVPKGCYEVYHTARHWRNFKNILEE